MTINWFNFVSQILATALGGALVIFSNYLSHRHERRLEEERQQDRNAALMTGVFVIRNFVMDELGRFEEAIYTRRDIAGFRTALVNLQSIIEKSPPDTQYVMATIFELSLRLGDLVSGLENIGVYQEELDRRIQLVYDALESFDLFAHQDLTLMTNEEVAKIVSNPEEVLRDRNGEDSDPE